MDEPSNLTTMNAWMRKNSRPVAIIVLALWVSPALLIATAVIVMSVKEYPALASAAALAILLVVIRVVRNLRLVRDVQES